MLGRVQRNLRWARLFARVGLPRGFRARAAYRGVRWPGGARWAACFSFDLDYEEDEAALPEVLGAFAGTSAHGSFACIGRHASLRPAPYRDIASAGHEVLNHSMTHPFHKVLSPSRHWNELSKEEVLAEVARAHEVLASVVGGPPVGFRAPHFERNPAQAEALASLGYAYDSSGVHAEEAPGDALPILGGAIPEVPIHRAASTWSHFRGPQPRPDSWEGEVASTLDRERARGGIAVFCFDPQDCARVPGALARLLRRAVEGGAWVGTILEVVRHVEALP